MITSLLLIHGIYPFFIHTRLIGKLGFLEYILVTPSHHRVHHASDEKYLDKNYGDVLIIWDKLFGTFKKEEEEPKYGLTKPLKTYSFLWQHFHFAIEMWLALKTKRKIKDKLKVIFGKPAIIDPALRSKAETIFHIYQNEEPIERPLNRYVIWQMILLLTGLFFFILLEEYILLQVKACLSLVIILTLINCGAIMEQKRWIFMVEFLRFTVILLIPFCSTVYWQTKLFITILFVLVLFFYYRPMRKSYLSLVYRS